MGKSSEENIKAYKFSLRLAKVICMTVLGIMLIIALAWGAAGLRIFFGAAAIAAICAVWLISED